MPKAINIKGKRFGRLVAKEIVERGRARKWLAVCDCGGNTVTTTSKLTSGWTQSCGCLAKERASQYQYKHGGKGTKLYNLWLSINARCSPKHKNADRYYERGIRVCDRWKDFANFREDMGGGYRNGLEIDRIDNQGNYSPSNCRWVTRHQNIMNRENTLFIEDNGERITLLDYCKKYKKKYNTERSKLYRSRKNQ